MTTNSPEAQRLARMTNLLVQDPGNESLRQHCVQLALSLRDFDQVIAVADIALAARPGDATASFDRATGLIGKQDYRGALAVLTTLRETQPETFGIDFNIALCRYCMAEYADALPLLESCYARGFRDAGLLRLLVTSYHHLSRMEDATRICAENQEPAKTDPVLAGAYALAYMDANDAGKAAKWAAIALKLNPKSIDGRVVQATLLTARLEVQKAGEMLQSVIADAPQTARAWVGLGALALLQRDLPTARSLLSRGVELMPGHVGSWHVLGWTQLMQKDLDAAEGTFAHALELDRNFAESHGALAAIAGIRGDRVRAEHLIEVALRLDPQCLSARFARSVLHRQAGDAAQADAMFDEAAEVIGARDSSALARLLRQGRGKSE